ncbi:hypothetical protein CL1_0346 [Thermococcus cleftensis]|uniref:Uncharacterized protein n=1 Tax=Thermococcus cleftensis (strain DSM 27260 / KACC 17922 / CL1) TaxID=163003 RepID=I3ZS73_THECF|nr:hypothetical protein CL1_0346 [Thermococcus cleftensis]
MGADTDLSRSFTNFEVSNLPVCGSPMKGGFEEPVSRVILMRNPQTFPSLARG